MNFFSRKKFQKEKEDAEREYLKALSYKMEKVLTKINYLECQIQEMKKQLSDKN